MNPTKFLNFLRFCMDKDGGAAAGAPATATADTNANASAAATQGTTTGDAATASQQQTSAAAAVTQPVGQQATTAEAGDFRAAWPDELKNDPSLKDMKDTASIAKALVDTKKLVGQKLGIPNKDSTPEAAGAFWDALGVPKDGAGYEFKQPDNLPAALKDTYDQAHADKWAGIFKKHNIPKEAANALRNELFTEIGAEVAEMKGEVDKSDEAFGKMAAEIYGDNTKATAALQAVKTIIEKHLPAQLKGALDKMSNTALLATAAAISGEMKALTGEDNSIGRDSGVTADGKTIAQLREEARTIQALPEYSSPFTTKGKVAHEDAVAKAKGIYARIDTMMKGGAKA